MSDSKVLKLRPRLVRSSGLLAEVGTSQTVHDADTQFSADRAAEFDLRIDDLVDGISDGFSLYDPQDRLVVWNEKFAEILHYARDLMVPGVQYETLVRKCAFEFFQNKIVTFEEKEAWVEEAFHFHRTQGTYERVTADGKYYLVSRRRTAKGYTAVVWTDITARKETEQSLQQSELTHRELFEGASHGILIQDGKSILKFNRAFAGIFGLRGDASLKTAKDLNGLIAPHERKRVQQIRNERLAATSGSSDFEIQGLRQDGKPIWIQATATSIAWKGKPAVQTSFHDITHRREFEEELLARKLESVTRMAHGIALEFNKVYSDVFKAIRVAKLEAYAAGLDVVTERLSEAEQCSTAAMDLVQQLLMLHRGGAPVMERTSIEYLLREAMPVSNRGGNVVSMRKDRTQISIGFGRRMWPICVDRTQIIGVLKALIAQGLHAMPFGGSLAIQAENVKLERKAKGIPLPAGRYVRVRIVDQGPGLAEDTVARIFDPFFKPGQQSAGIGMASSYAVAKHHGGTITVDSKQGKGTRLDFYLPATKESER